MAFPLGTLVIRYVYFHNLIVYFNARELKLLHLLVANTFLLKLLNTKSTIGVILTHSFKLFAYICKVTSNRNVKLTDFS